MIFREEHPNPQWERNTWRNLNGEWEFEFDFGKTARDREVYKNGALSKRINVPFCPESELSGIGYKDFMNAVCYRKIIELSEEELQNNVILHFGAIDYKSYIYINQQLAKTHIGGFSSFEVDISEYVKPGKNEIFVIAEDDLRDGKQPSGKQSWKHDSFSCVYTRTTGIWQTVWLEFVPKDYIKKAKFYPDAENGTITVSGEVCGKGTVEVTAYYEGKVVGTDSQIVKNNFYLKLKLSEIHLWEPGCGRLYDLEFKFGKDKVKSYFGLRNVGMEGKKFVLNSECVFQRFVLDQGYYPDGILTAKSDEELKRDINISMNAGFNGARLHQKVFEKRFLYHCDKSGYMVWGEHANWGMNYRDEAAIGNFICEWMEIIERDFNHPSIIGWCPFNETWGYYELKEERRFIESVYKLTKQMDNTRPCIAVSGNYHIEEMEFYDIHDYCGDIEEFRDNYAHIEEGYINGKIRNNEGDIQKYKGQGVYVSEYGGFALIEEGEEGWGYGNNPKTPEELFEKYKSFTDVLLDNPDIMGFCYTQLYDVEQEKNGLYTYQREPKLDIEKIKKVNSKKARIEFI